MILKSCDYRKLNENCLVVNSNEVDDFLTVRLPHEMSGFRLYDFLDVSQSQAKTVSFEDVVFDCYHPWIDIPWKNLNRVAGKHVYKLSFMDERDKRYLTTYISYIIQDDSPYKPYLYMKDRYNEDEEEKQGIYLGWY